MVLVNENSSFAKNFVLSMIWRCCCTDGINAVELYIMMNL